MSSHYGKHTNNPGEEYDREFNLFYLSVHPKSKKLMGGSKEMTYDSSKTSNIIVYDVKKKTSLKLFDQVSDKEVITHLLFETAYDEKQEQVVFNRYSSKVQNNGYIERRSLKNRLLVCQEDMDSHKKKLWTFTKYGGERNLLATLDRSEEWRLDVHNSKIRTFFRSIENPAITDYDW